MTVAEELTAALRKAVVSAEHHERALQAAYAKELRRGAVEMGGRFRDLTSLTAAAEWTPPTVADVLAVSTRAGRINSAQRAMLASVAGTIGAIDGVDFDLTHPVTQSILDRLGERVPSTIGSAARETVARVISTSWAEGASVPETASAITAAVKGVADFRATMLARTDLISISNAGGQWAAHQLNDASRQAGEPTVVASKTWLSAGDDRVRDTHQEADGQTVPIGEPYQVGDAMLLYPGDPDGPDEEVINCRCVEIYNEDVGDAGASPGGEDLVASALRTKLSLIAADISLHRPASLVEAARKLSWSPVRFNQSKSGEAAMSGTLIEDVTSDTFAANDTTTRQRWGSDIAFEGMGTGDGRFMVDGSLSWREPPLTLMAMIETPDVGGHAGAQVAGRMDSFSKSTKNMDGKALAKGVTAVYSEGIMDTGEFAQDIERMVEDETLRGVSVDLAILEWGFRDPDTGEMFNPDEMTPDEWDRAFMGELYFAVIQGEIMAATVCPTPAFADARIALLASARLRPMVWRAGAEYASAHGLPADQLMTTLVAAAHQLDESLTAAAAPKGIAPLAPPSEWFFRPEAAEATPLTITDDGEIFGHIALWETCHTGFINGEWSQCITPPKSKTGYARFQVGEVVSREGEHIPIGNLTIGCGHAPMQASPKAVREHYDNSGSIGAFVRAIDGKHGVWVCGATRSDMTPEQLRDLRACPPSGDWRSIDHNLELHAALAVPVPGFPVTRSQIALAASADGGVEIVALILTASGIDTFVEPTEVTVSADVLAAMIDGGVDALDALIQA